MNNYSEFRYKGEVVDAEGRTWQVDHDYTLPTGAQWHPLTTPVIFTTAGKSYRAKTIARGPLSDAEYLTLLMRQQEAESRKAQRGGE